MLIAVSPKLRAAVFELRSAGVRQYTLAQRVGVHPSMISHLLKGSVPIHKNDARVLRLAAAVGVPADEAFATEARSR